VQMDGSPRGVGPLMVHEPGPPSVRSPAAPDRSSLHRGPAYHRASRARV